VEDPPTGNGHKTPSTSIRSFSHFISFPPHPQYRCRRSWHTTSRRSTAVPLESVKSRRRAFINIRSMSPLHLRLRRRLLLLLLLLRDDHDHGGANAFAPSSSTTSTSSTSRARITRQPSYFLEIYAGRSISRCHNSIPRRRMMMLSKMSSNENNNNNININSDEDNDIINDDDEASASSSALSRQEEAVSKKPNPYLSAIATPPPSDLISAFANTASPRAKNAARATIAGLMGGLTSNMMNGGQKGYEDGLGGMAGGGANNDSGVGGVGSASRGAGGGGVMDAQSRGGDANANNVGFTSKIVATGARLANLMFQLQMTGYMLRNAEYRLELGRSLGASSESSGTRSSGRMLPSQLLELDAEKEEQRRGRIVKGTKIKVRYGGGGGASGASSEGGEEETTTEEDDDNVTGKDEDAEKESVSSSFMGLEVEVDAKAYVSELRGEIKRLRDAIESTRREKEEKVEEDLL
jgi:hypothetical protein